MKKILQDLNFAQTEELVLSLGEKKFRLQFLPDEAYGAGFYVCKMRKKGEERA